MEDHATYEECVRWLHGMIGRRVLLRVAEGHGLPLSMSFGLLARGVDPARAGDHRERLQNETAEILAFAIGETTDAYTAFTLSESRFVAARIARVADDEVLSIRQGHLFIIVAPEHVDLRAPQATTDGHE